MEPFYFDSNTTLKWPCRAGDYILWCRFKGIFHREGKQYKLADIWQLRDGDFVTLTNRRYDIPSWFELHPLEVSNSFIYWMKKKLDSGYNPSGIIDGPNIWRVFAGDRIVWVGNDRPGFPSDEGILSLITFLENALIIGESHSDANPFEFFGGFNQEEQSQEELHLCQYGWAVVNDLGMPRTVMVDGKWTLG